MNSNNYDLVIIGAGPAGLALAQCCSKINTSILIIDREDTIGGCHRVRRVLYNNELLFTEHGPRIYSSTYKVFIMLLKEIGVDFYELFTPYNFTIGSIGGQTIWTTLSYNELFKLFIEFILLIFDNNHGKDISMKEYLISKHFNNKSIDLIDKLCRLTDGASSEKYTLNEFLQLFNQQFFYKIYQPKLPNDIGFLKLWKQYLDNNNVQFMLSSNVSKLIPNENNTQIDSIILGDNTIIKGDKFVFAIPPLNISSILYNSNLNAFGDLNNFIQWSQETAYIDYLSVTFHWDTKVILPKVYGFPKTSWGIAFIVLSDYMTFNEKTSQTVISTAVTISDVQSSFINKTADQCNQNELINEIFNQLLESFPDIPLPTISILSPGVYNNGTKWISNDTAYISTSKNITLPFKSDIYKNLYNVGTHNGKSRYKFTSLEAAVTNAVELSYILHPELKDIYKIQSGYTVTNVIRILLILLILFIIYKNG